MHNAERVKELFNYDPETGVFTRRIDSPPRWKAGQIAGSRHSKHGYWIIRFDGRDKLAHRLAWLYVHGEWPTQDIDHIDGNPLNNRINNLRQVSKSVNMQNRKRAHKQSTSGLLGAYRNGKRWRSSIHIDGNPKHLGTFDTAEAAHAAYLAAKRLHHPGCTI